MEASWWIFVTLPLSSPVFQGPDGLKLIRHDIFVNGLLAVVFRMDHDC